MWVSDYPSNSQNRLKGVAVGLFVRYPLLGLSVDCYTSKSFELESKDFFTALNPC